MAKKLTVKDIFDLKGKRQLTQVFVSSEEEARACEAAGIEMIVTIGGRLREVRRGAPNTFITSACTDMVASETDAIRMNMDAIRNGADAIYCAYSTEWIAAMAKQGIPVVGHVGLVPSKCTWTGGYRAVGKTTDEALKVYRDTLAHQEAGAIGVEMEVVPHRVAAEIARRVKIAVISMGSGVGDIQYLFACDVLGANQGHVPRHAKVYGAIAKELARVQQLRVEALQAFKSEVDSGAYPEPKHLVEIKEDQFKAFVSKL